MSSPSGSAMQITPNFAPRRAWPQNHIRICKVLAPFAVILLATCAARGQSAPADKPDSADATQQDQQPKMGSAPASQTDAKSDAKQQAPATLPDSAESKKAAPAQG